MDILVLSIAILTFTGIWYCNGLLTRVLAFFVIEKNQALASWGNQLYLTRLIMILLSGLLVAFIGYSVWDINRMRQAEDQKIHSLILKSYDTTKVWEAPAPQYMLQDKHKSLLLYGRQLIANTADYLGPNGLVRSMSNGMNCQNCHLEAGTKPFGNNYAAVAATYPKFRARSGTEETITKRINDCFQRSLNGDSLHPQSREMKAITAYIQWLGQAVPKNLSPLGVGLSKVKILNRAADPEAGKLVYLEKCQSCHGIHGAGLTKPDNTGESYPPLWGEKSYNESAGLYRLSTFAGYVKTNMPFGATSENPQLTDQEAWDLAAFVNSQPRPKHKFLNEDWPDISKKPYDHPFGPYTDTFPEVQHKYGPFQPILDFQKNRSK